MNHYYPTSRGAIVRTCYMSLRQKGALHFLVVSFIAATVVWNGNALAQATKTWQPTTGGSWATAGNWSPSGAPGTGDNVVINSDQSANITSVPTITLNNLTI